MGWSGRFDSKCVVICFAARYNGLEIAARWERIFCWNIMRLFTRKMDAFCLMRVLSCETEGMPQMCQLEQPWASTNCCITALVTINQLVQCNGVTYFQLCHWYLVFDSTMQKQAWTWQCACCCWYVACSLINWMARSTFLIRLYQNDKVHNDIPFQMLQHQLWE